jgi:outer membrane receptor protein involved in Fe transport
VSNTAAPVTEGSLIDSAFPRALNAFGKYTLQRGTLRGAYVSAGATYRSRSRPYGTLENLYLLEHPSYTTYSAGVGYSWQRESARWHAEVMLKNASDEFYLTDTSIPSERRTAVFSVGVAF